MKTLVLSLALASLTMSASAETKLIDQPRYAENSSYAFNISSVLLSDTATIVNCNFYNRPNYWVALDKESKIIGRQSGKQYPILASYGYTLGEQCFMPESGTKAFSLKFAPLEPNDTIIDFIESDNDGFKITGLMLGNESPSGKIHCHISGTTDDATCSHFLFTKKGATPRSYNMVIVPVIDGKFHTDLYCEWPEVYSLIDGNEYRDGAFREFYFVSENNNVNMTITHDGDLSTVIVEGGEMNKILNDFTNESHTRFAHAYDSINKSMDSLYNENKLYTDEFNAIMKRLSQNETTPEMRNELFHQRDSLQEIEMEYTPEGNALKHRAKAITDNIRKWRIDYAKTHKSIPGLEILLNFTYYDGNNIDDVIEAYNECYAGWETEHPYSLAMAMITSSNKIEPGTHFIDFSAPDLDGNEVTLSSQAEGKITLLDLWASWCGPCRINSKQMIPIYDTYKDKGFTIVGVAREDNNTKAMEEAIKKDGYEWLNLVEINDKNQIWTKYRIANAAGGRYLIDRNGIIVAVNPTAAELEKYLKENL